MADRTDGGRTKTDRETACNREALKGGIVTEECWKEMRSEKEEEKSRRAAQEDSG